MYLTVLEDGGESVGLVLGGQAGEVERAVVQPRLLQPQTQRLVETAGRDRVG